MKFNSGLSRRLSFFVILVACYEHAVSGYQLNEDDYNHGEDDYDYEDAIYDVPPPPPPGSTGASEVQHSLSNTHTIPCYSCHFIFQHNHQQGHVNCKDPFSPHDIPVVNCRGACAKVYRKLEEKSDFELARNCMPNCKEFRLEKDNIECCTTELCNGFLAASSLNNRIRTLATAFVALVLLFLLLR